MRKSIIYNTNQRLETKGLIKENIEGLEYVSKLKLLGIEVQFEEENIRTLSTDIELMLTVLFSFTEHKGRRISENVKWRFRKKFKEGNCLLV